MDWAAGMLGLDAAFYNTSGIGGGVIQVDIDVPVFYRFFSISPAVLYVLRRLHPIRRWLPLSLHDLGTCASTLIYLPGNWCCIRRLKHIRWGKRQA